MSDEEKDENFAAMWYYSEIMRQLMESERFVNWFQLNFDYHKIVNEEEKSIEIRVIEVPPEEVQKRMMAEMAQHVKDAPSVVTASPEDLRALEKRGKK